MMSAVDANEASKRLDARACSDLSKSSSMNERAGLFLSIQDDISKSRTCSGESTSLLLKVNEISMRVMGSVESIQKPSKR